jgi:VWFA-related protein
VAPPSTPTLRTGVQLVVEDVVVTDKNGTPMHGLQQGDFTVLENKAEQPIKGFEEHAGEAITRAVALLPGTFSNVPATTGRVVNVLLLDGLNTPPQSQPYLRDQLVKFLAMERPGTQTAVFALNYRLGLLQDFTTDPDILKHAVKLQGVQFSPLLNRELNDQPGHKESEAITDLIMLKGGSSPALEDMQRTLLDMQARQVSQQTQVRARITIEALKQLARYLAGVPGRKNLLWFSGSFPVSIQRDIHTTGDPFAGQADLHDELKVTVDLLAKNQVAVYPIDARGPRGCALAEC